MNARSFRYRVWAASLLAATSLGCTEAPKARSTQPFNVVLMSIDCLNQRQFLDATERGIVPAMETLAEDSWAFLRGYSHAPWTTPSHMSMLTGLYPRQHGRDIPYSIMIPTNRHFDRLPTHPTLAGTLSRHGYETIAMVGKGSISGKFGLDRHFQSYEESAKDPDTNSDLSATSRTFQEWVVARDGRPFLLFWHTYDLHGPLPVDHPDPWSAIGHIDEHVATVVAALKEQSLYDLTLIILTGDHGSRMIRAAGRCCIHGAGHYEENLRVPLLVKLPAAFADGTTGLPARGESGAIARHVDILPTVLGILDLDEPEYAGPGVSLLDVALGSARTEFSFSEADARCSRRFGLVGRQYKYIYTPHGVEQWLWRREELFVDEGCKGPCRYLPPEEEFYDLAADPVEAHNLISDGVPEMLAPAVDRFRKVMDQHLNLPPQYSRLVVADDRSLSSEIDSDLERSLRALGYLQ